MVVPVQISDDISDNRPSRLLFYILALLWLLPWWEIFRVWKSLAKDNSWIQLFLTKYYRLSTTALLLGVGWGVLYALHDAWTYTNALQPQVQSLWQPFGHPLTINYFKRCFVVWFYQRCSLRFRLRRIQTGPHHLIGGALMRLGAVLILGGNDILILNFAIAFASCHTYILCVALRNRDYDAHKAIHLR